MSKPVTDVVGIEEGEADSPDAPVGHLLQLSVGDPGVDDRDPPGIGRPELGDGVEGDGVGRAVGAGRHDHGPRRSDPLLEAAVFRRAGVRHEPFGRPGGREAAVVDVEVAIAGVRRRLEFRRPCRRNWPPGILQEIERHLNPYQSGSLASESCVSNLRLLKKCVMMRLT